MTIEELIRFFDVVSKGEDKKMNFLEKLSCIFGKQYLFKETKYTYYNRYTDEYMSKDDAREWLYTMFSDLYNDKTLECAVTEINKNE